MMPPAADAVALFASFASDQPFVKDFRTAKSGVLHVADTVGRLSCKHFWVVAPEVADSVEEHFRGEGYVLIASDIFCYNAPTVNHIKTVRRFQIGSRITSFL